VVFSLDRFLIPAHWSQVAADILAQKYFRKAGVPARAKRVEENSVPSWLWRSLPDADTLATLPEEERFGSETDARQVFDRLAGTWTYWGWKGGYFSKEEDASAFNDELRYMLAMQMGAPNSPQWFNTGLHWAYGIDGPSQGHYYVDFASGEVKASESAYEHPQPHACFIQSIDDDLVNENGIMDLWVREARLFKYGSGTGTNFSRLRGENEPLSGGGKSSGLMSFLKIGDRAAGAIKSGGTTRRAAKMVVVDTEGGLARHRLQDPGRAAQRHPQGLHQLRRRRGRLLRPQAQPGAEARGQSGAAGQGAGQLYPPGDPVRPAGLHLDPVPDLRHGLGLGGLPHRIRPELQQLGAPHRRVPACGRG
jgi:hypothetical protein